MTKSHFNDESATHPKLAIAEAMVGDAAPTMWWKAIVYCNRHLTDGLVPVSVLGTLTRHKKPKAVADALVAARLVPTGAGLFEIADGGYAVHDFLAHNPSRADVEAYRSRESDRKRDSYGKRVVSAKSPPGERARGARSTDVVRSESERSPSDPARTIAAAGVGLVNSSSGLEGSAEGADAEDPHPAIRRAYGEAVNAAAGRFTDPNKWANPEDSDALDWAWRDAVAKGGALPDFLEWLVEQVTAWVVAVRSEGGERFTAGWRPTKFAAWVADGDAEKAP